MSISILYFVFAAAPMVMLAVHLSQRGMSGSFVASIRGHQSPNRRSLLRSVVPFSRHVNDRIVSTVEGELMMTWEIAGLEFEGRDMAYLRGCHESLD